MRTLLTLTFVMLATSSAAHPGHLIELAGHDHWAAGIAIGLAGLAGIWGAIKGGKKEESSDDDPEAELEEEAA